MEPDRSEIIQSLRAEALALFQASQTGRLAAERAAQLLLTITGVAVAVAIDSRSNDVLLALPPVVLLLVSYMCQQYADVSVMGAARAAIERRLRTDLGGHALIYETLVADIRKQRPLVWSVRVFQSAIGAVIVGVVLTGLIVAIDQRAHVTLGYLLVIAATAASALMSFRDMRRSTTEATSRLTAELGIERANAAPR